MAWTRTRLWGTWISMHAVSFAVGVSAGCGTDSAVIESPAAGDAGNDVLTFDAAHDADTPRDADARDASRLDAARDASPDASCATDCGEGRACCNGACVDLRNDPHNCGACGNECGDDRNWCDGVEPGITPFCSPQVACAVDYNPPRLCPGYNAVGLCCGYDCCERDELCCTSMDSPGLSCFKPTPEQPTCPPLPPHWPNAD